MLYGLFSFGKVAFTPKTDIPDLSGKVILVTGGNVGLGKETILQLSQHNPTKIYLAARTESKAVAAIQELQLAVPNAPIEFLPCDLTSFKSIQACAKQFVAKEKRLDLLYLNAGVMAVPYATTQEGYEIQFGTNHVGHALLTKLLLPTLLKTAEEPGSDVRVIAVSSIGHSAVSGLKFDALKTDMKSYNTWTCYGQSKLANILFAKELAARYPQITTASVHPGFVQTELYTSTFESYAGIGERIGRMAQKNIMTSVQDGAKGQLWAGVAPKKSAENTKGVESGTYYTPVGVTGQGTRAAGNDKLAKQLWEWTEKELDGWEL